MSETAEQRKYSQILNTNGISHEIEEVIFKGKGDLAGEHFGSVCEFVTIKFKNNLEPCYLFIKKCLPSTNPKEMESARKLIIKEGIFLTTILDQISLKNSRNGRSPAHEELVGLFPKTYFSDENEIIMEDIGSRGYRMLKKTDKHNFVAAKAVIESLAIFHAASFAWLQKLGGKVKVLQHYSFMTEVYDWPGVEEQTRQSLEPAFDTLLKILQKSSVQNIAAYEKISKYRGKLMQTIMDTIHSPNPIFDVMGHGDLWNNNMMFSESMENVIFLDFQVLRINSPTFDLVYYLFTSASSEVRLKWKELLKIYFDKFLLTSKSMGEVQPNTDFKELVEDFQAKSPMGLMMGLFMSIGLEGMAEYHVNEAKGFEADKFAEAINKWISNNPIRLKQISDDESILILDAAQIVEL